MNEFSFNVNAFIPFQGGRGKRFAVSGTSASVAIPGLAGGTPAPYARVMVSNGGDDSIFVRMGDSTVVADTDCMEVLPGCDYLLAPPFTGLGGVYLAAITEGAVGKVSVISGTGT